MTLSLCLSGSYRRAFGRPPGSMRVFKEIAEREAILRRRLYFMPISPHPPLADVNDGLSIDDNTTLI